MSMKKYKSLRLFNLLTCCLFLMSFIQITAQKTIVKNSLYDKYIELSEDYFKMNNWRKSLSKEQRKDLDNHIDYIKLKQFSNDCSAVKRTARTLSGASSLIYTSRIDFKFFKECNLWYNMQEMARKNEKKDALQVLKKIADGGDYLAQMYYAMNHSWLQSGFGLSNLKQKEDMNIFFKYMKMAYDNGDTTADNQLVEGYEYIKDYKSAMNWINVVITETKYEKDKANYYWKRGTYYLEGKGVKKNIDKAYNNFKKAADIDRLYYWTYSFGVDLYEGINFPQNRSEGIKYLRKAAESGSSKSAEKYCREHNISFKKASR